MSDFDKLHCVFTTQVRQENESFVIDVPEREVELGEIKVGEIYQVAVLPSTTQIEASPERSRSEAASESPVEVGEIIEVEIEDIGSKGDGVARIGGYVIFVPDTTLNERVSIEITETRENMAFAEVVGRLDP